MKHAKLSLFLGLAALAGALIVLAAPAAALPQYAAATGQACSVCHVNPAGGGALTPRGTAFAAIPTHATDPAGAFTASAASASPSAAASPSPSAAASPSPSAAASPSPSASASPSAVASPSASPSPSATGLPKTGGMPILPFGLISGFGIFAIGWITRRFSR